MMQNQIEFNAFKPRPSSLKDNCTMNELISAISQKNA
jgi:hypothetical protein